MLDRYRRDPVYIKTIERDDFFTLDDLYYFEYAGNPANRQPAILMSWEERQRRGYERVEVRTERSLAGPVHAPREWYKYGTRLPNRQGQGSAASSYSSAFSFRGQWWSDRSVWRY